MDKVTTKSAKVYYYKYKDTVYFAIGILALTIVACLFLFLQFIVPEFQKWFDMNNEVAATQQRVDALNHNIKFIESLDDSTVSDNFDKATTALPVEKDFGGAMQEILSSAINAGVSLKTFQFSVGTVATKSATLSATDLAPMDIQIDATGDGLAMTEFIKSLSERLPLSTVTSATSNDSNASSTQISISFPSKSVSDLTFDKLAPMPSLTASDQKLLEQLAGWDSNSQAPTDNTTTSSGSANLPPPF